MNIDALDANFQTALFITFLVAITILTAKKDSGPHEMNHSHTDELKGVAILMVIFSHIGYFLFSDHKFLYPLSVAGGVGVNIFLFLSGFGLTKSEIKLKKPLLSFYFKRLRNIFIPMWFVLIPVLILDAVILGRTYNFTIVAQSILGFFPNSDLDSAANFPLVYLKKNPLLSALAVFVIGFFMVSIKLPVSVDVLKLYKLHIIAFPLGMVFACLDLGKIGVKINNLNSLVRYAAIFLLFLLFAYTAINSGVGSKIMTEQLLSLVTMSTLILIFLVKNIQSEALITLGKYSYEIYLIQWPFMYRYDFIYKYTPPFLGTLIYILLFLIIGKFLNTVVKTILKF